MHSTITYGKKNSKRARSNSSKVPGQSSKRLKEKGSVSPNATDSEDEQGDRSPWSVSRSAGGEPEFYNSKSATPARGSQQNDLSRRETEPMEAFDGQAVRVDVSRIQLNPTSPKRSTGIAKRMLSRSNSSVNSANLSGTSTRSQPLGMTDTVIDLTSGTDSVNSSSVSLNKPLTPTKATKSFSLDDQSPPIKTQTSTIRTYAGTSRSFLVTVPTTSNVNPESEPTGGPDVLLSNSQDDLEIYETYSDLRARWGVDNSEDDPYPLLPEALQTGKRTSKTREVRPAPIPLPVADVKSITELRNKGESRRFHDEVGYLFEGLDPDSSLSVRRGSASEILSKFSDLEFVRKAKVADFTVQAWEALRESGAGDGDKVLGSALAVFVALVARDTRDIADLARRTHFVPVLFRMLASSVRKSDTLTLINAGLSDAELRKAGIARTEKPVLVNLNRIIKKESGIFYEDAALSNRLLITTALASLPASLHQTENIPTLLDSLLSETSIVPHRVSGYASGLPLLPPVSSDSYIDTPSFAHIENCLQLLEAFLLDRWTSRVDEGDDDTSNDLVDRRHELWEGLVACCIATDTLMRDAKSEGMSTSARRCLESALRVLINLSHNSQPWCQSLLDEEHTIPMVIRFIVTAHQQRYGQAEVTQGGLKPEEKDAQAFDRLCLALGLLTNLVQVEEKAKDLSRETTLYMMCPNKWSCVRVCICPQRVGALQCLITIYLQHRNTTTDDEIDPIIRGHFAILFGLLMRDNVPNQREILAALPGKTTCEKLNPLLESAQEFVDLYGQVMARVAQGAADDDDGETGDVISKENKRAADGFEEQSISRDVIAFLEILSSSPDF